MDWFNALMPLTPSHNLEDPVKANVKGNKVTKFSVTNWAAYTNTKALLVDVGESRHIYAGKFKPLAPEDINKIPGVYTTTAGVEDTAPDKCVNSRKQ